MYSRLSKYLISYGCHRYASLVGEWVLTINKAAWISKSPKIREFCPLGLPPKEMSTFLIIIAKVRFSQTFFMQKVCFHRVWFELYGCLNGRNCFFSLRNKGFPPKMTSQKRYRWPRNILNCAVLRIQWYLRWLSRPIPSEVMVAQILAGHYRESLIYSFWCCTAVTCWKLQFCLKFW